MAAEDYTALVAVATLRDLKALVIGRSMFSEPSRHDRESENHKNSLIRIPPELRNRLYSMLLPRSRNILLEFPIKGGSSNLPSAAILQVCRAVRTEAASFYFKGTTLEVVPKSGMHALPWLPLSLRNIPNLPACLVDTVKVTIGVMTPDHLHYNSTTRPEANGTVDTRKTIRKLTMTFVLNADNTYTTSTAILVPEEERKFISWPVAGRTLSCARKFVGMIAFATEQIGRFEEEMKTILAGRSISASTNSPEIKFFSYLEDVEE